MDTRETLNNLPFFYILSMGRSGSTLLEFILDAHSQVNIPLESRFIIHLYYKYRFKTIWSDQEKKEFINDLYLDYKFRMFWKVDKDKLEEDVLNTPSNVTFFELCRIITFHYQSFYEKENITIQGNKNPIHAFWPDILYQLNPKAKFIHLVRNPMGVVASHKKLEDHRISYLAYRWNLMNQKIEAIKALVPENFITIKYENLLTDPEKHTRLICSFLDIDYTPAMLDYYKAIRSEKEKITPAETEKMNLFNSHLKNLVNPIQIGISDSWKNTLTIKERKNIAYITSKLSKKYEYNLSEEQGNFKFSFLFAKLKNQYRYIRHRLYYRLSYSLK